MIDITIDTREKNPFHFDEAFAVCRRGTLKTGDYAVTGDSGFAVERKSLSDFLGTIGKGWQRFQKEMYRARDAGFPSFPIVVESCFSDVIFKVDDNGNIIAPSHDHPKMIPSFVLKRIGELSQMGGVVVFADGAIEAAMLTYSFLLARHKDLHRDDADEFSGQKDIREGR